MKKVTLILALVLSSFLTFTSCDDDAGINESPQFQVFNDAMRQLWTDHVWWTRNVITNIVDGLPGTTEAVNRLLQNQDDIGDAIKPYYGDAAGESLSTLLRTHITQAADLLTAAKNGDTNAFNTINAAWYANADEIAAFLHNANPDNFALATMENMMAEHLDLTLVEATARLDGNYAADVAAFDQVFEHIMMMADLLSDGIGAQFPDKF